MIKQSQTSIPAIFTVEITTKSLYMWGKEKRNKEKISITKKCKGKQSKL